MSCRQLGAEVGESASNYTRYERTRPGARRDIGHDLIDRLLPILGFERQRAWFNALVAYTHAKERGSPDEVQATRYKLDVQTARLQNSTRPSTTLTLTELGVSADKALVLKNRHLALRQQLLQFTERTDAPRKFLAMTLGISQSSIPRLRALLDDTRHLCVALGSRQTSGPLCTLHLEAISLTREAPCASSSAPNKHHIYVQSYDSAVGFLRAWLQSQPTTQCQLAKRAGIDPTTLRRRLKAGYLTRRVQKVIAAALLEIGEFCQHDDVDDVAFFELLAARDRASPSLRAVLDAQIHTIRTRLGGLQRHAVAEEVMGDWVCAALGELVRWAPGTPEELGRMLHPTVSTDRTRMALRKLVQAGFVVVHQGRYLPTHGTPIAFRAGEPGELQRAYAAYHLVMRREAERRTQEGWLDPARTVQSMLLHVGRKQFPTMVEILTQARDRAAALLESSDDPLTRVIQVNLHLAPYQCSQEG